MLWRGSLTERASHDGLPYNGCRHQTHTIDDRACRPSVELSFRMFAGQAQTLPLIGGTTAGPAGSSQRKLQRLPAFT
jgi:hypothetical protein